MIPIWHERGITVETDYTWKIKDFSKLPEECGRWYESPKFSSPGFIWKIIIYPYGKDFDSKDWIGLHLQRVDKGLSHVFVRFTLGFKKTDKTIKYVKEDQKVTFSKKHSYGWWNFMKRSELMGRNEEFIPSDILTINCLLKQRGPCKLFESNKNWKKVYDETPQLKEDKNEKEGYAKSNDDDEKPELKEDKNEEKSSAKSNDDDEKPELKEDKNEEEGYAKSNGPVALFLSLGEPDITIIVRDKEFKAHKSLLEARSDVFAAMLNHTMKEANEGIINITDYAPEIFEAFLSCLYGSNDKLDGTNIFEVYCIADKYLISNIKTECVRSIENLQTANNILNIMEFAKKFKDDMLLRNAFIYFYAHQDHILTTSEWESFSRINPRKANQLNSNIFKRRWKTVVSRMDHFYF